MPLVYIGLPTFYGSWLMVVFGLTQHAGLAEDVLDHRLNCRTVFMNPVFRFIYWNMGYHVEHHMFPMVPYHALPARCTRKMKADAPPPYHGLLGSLPGNHSSLVGSSPRIPPTLCTASFPPNAHAISSSHARRRMSPAQTMDLPSR